MPSIVAKYLLKSVFLGMALSALVISGFIFTATWFRLSDSLTFTEKVLEMVGINLVVIHLLVPLITFIGVVIGLGRLLVNRELISISSSVTGRRLLIATITLPLLIITVTQMVIVDLPGVKRLYLAEQDYVAEQTTEWYQFNGQFFQSRATEPSTITHYTVQNSRILAFGEQQQNRPAPLRQQGPDDSAISATTQNALSERISIIEDGFPRPDISWTLADLVQEKFSESPWADSPDLHRLLTDRFIRLSWAMPLFFMVLALLSNFGRHVALSSLVGKAVLGLFIAGVGAEAANLLASKLGANEITRATIPLIISSLTAYLVSRK